MCWWDGGLSTTAREPKEARSITRGGLPVSRWCGDTFTSAGEEPTDETVELCHSTAYAMSHGHRRVGASVESLIAAAVLEMSPMVRSAIGFRSWSCGGEVVWWMSSDERNDSERVRHQLAHAIAVYGADGGARERLACFVDGRTNGCVESCDAPFDRGVGVGLDLMNSTKT